MSDTNNKNSFLPDNAITEISGKIYDDALHKPLMQVGDALGSIMKFVALPFSFLGITADELTKKYQAFAEKTLNKVPKEKLVEPSSIIAGPILEYIKFLFDEENLIEMFSNLLAADMNSDKKGLIHPSFVDNIRRMSSLDAKLLSHLYSEQFLLLSHMIATYQKKNILQLNQKSFDIFSTKNEEMKSFQILKTLGLIEIDNYCLNYNEYQFNILNEKTIKLPCKVEKYFKLKSPSKNKALLVKDNLDFLDFELSEKFNKMIIKLYKKESLDFFVNRTRLYLTEYGEYFMDCCLPSEI